MSNLIPDEEKSSYLSALTDVFDTFAKDIVVWQRASERITSIDDNNDAFYDNKKKPNVVYTYQSGIIPAVVKYIDRQDKEFYIAMSAAQVQLTVESQLVRIKVKEDSCESVQEAEKVTVDGIDFQVITAPRQYGLFSNNFCTFYLKS